ncbi:MAG TPA: polysaccharide lyase [Niastella sp.]
MKTPMFTKGNLLRNNQRTLTVSLLLATLFACKKETSVNEDVSAEELNSSVSTKAIGNLLYQENADGTWFNNSFAKMQAAASYSITASTAQAYSGTKSIRFELRDTDPEVQGGTRAEMTFPVTTNMNRWYSYALYIPSAQYKAESEDEVITQWHQGGGATPALCLRTRGDHFWLRVLGTTWIDLGAIDKDKWHSYVWHVKHSSGSDGLVEIWRDGTKILNRTGPNGYPLNSTYHMPFFKYGVYKSDWNGSGTTATNLRVLYFDEVKMGNENATYNDMVPSGSGSTTPTTPTTPTIPTTLGVVSFSLVNSGTEKDVQTIADGSTITLSTLGLTKANIRAVTTSDVSGSVKFELSGQQSKTSTDNAAPFALHGDDGLGNYFYGNWNPPAAGTYTLKATPYSGDNLTGTAGTPKTITFTIK